MTTRYEVEPIVDRLRAERLRRELPWAAFARQLGVPVATLLKLDAGRVKRPHQITLARIHRALALLETQPNPR